MAWPYGLGRLERLRDLSDAPNHDSWVKNVSTEKMESWLRERNVTPTTIVADVQLALTIAFSVAAVHAPGRNGHFPEGRDHRSQTR